LRTMNERADNINGLVEHQMMVRFSPKLAERVHREFFGVSDAQRPKLDIKWDERNATVTFGPKKYPGVLFDLPCVTETYKMVSKSRLFKSGDIGQVLVVYDPNDAEDAAFFEQQKHDPFSNTLLSGITPPSTFTWSRIFKKQNRAPKVDFAKVEQDLGEVNVAGKEDVEVDFIHPKELDTLMLKPGQKLVVDGIDVEPIPGLSVGAIILQKRREQEERLKKQLQEEKRRKKEEKRKKKEAAGKGGDPSTLKKIKVELTPGAAVASAAVVPSWQKAVMMTDIAKALEGELAVLVAELESGQANDERAMALRASIEEKKRQIQAALRQ